MGSKAKSVENTISDLKLELDHHAYRPVILKTCVLFGRRQFRNVASAITSLQQAPQVSLANLLEFDELFALDIPELTGYLLDNNFTADGHIRREKAAVNAVNISDGHRRQRAGSKE